MFKNEMSIKALLTHLSIRFKKVHDLDVLLELLNDSDFNNLVKKKLGLL
jgi:HEPN domain-containing protein